ncbi:hypothetical protein K7432_003944 [Basidiobolus ranarum]|uniref:Uncharacterized protein n=1 Tax=Basidiobolus ranarum TaxID=34480 RepID=A0ABR2WZ24_9FUNG
MMFFYSLFALPLAVLSLPHSHKNTTTSLKGPNAKSFSNDKIVLPDSIEFTLFVDNDGNGASWSTSVQSDCVRIPDELNNQTSALSLKSNGCINLYDDENCGSAIGYYCYSNQEVTNVSQDINDRAGSVHRCSYVPSPIEIKDPCEIY